MIGGWRSGKNTILSRPRVHGVNLEFNVIFPSIFSKHFQYRYIHVVQSKFLHRKGIQKYCWYKFFFENVASKQCKFYFWFLLFFRSYSILIWVMYNKCHKNDLKKGRMNWTHLWILISLTFPNVWHFCLISFLLQNRISTNFID